MKNKITGTDDLSIELSNSDFTIGNVYDTFQDSNQEFQMLKENLLSSDKILKVLVKSNGRAIFQGLEYEVEVIEDIQNDRSMTGETIKLLTVPFPLIYEQKLIFGTFTNFLQKGKTYLVYLDTIDESMNPGNRYFLRENALINYFLLEEVEDVPVEPTGQLYKDVRNNEFFATEKGLEELKSFKQQMLEILQE